MTALTRRFVTAGLGAAVTAIPAVGLCVAAKGSAAERVEHLTRELEKAMLECHPGSKIVTMGQNVRDGFNPFVFIAATPEN